MKIGLGGSLGPFRGGISTRGVGVGAGPVSAGSNFRRKSSRTEGVGLGAFVVGGLAVVLLVAWPYLLRDMASREDGCRFRLHHTGHRWRGS